MSTPFQLGSVPALSRSDVDRAEELRSDAERLRARWPKANVVVLDVRGRTPVPYDGERTSPSLAVRDAAAFGEEPPDGAVFLGSTDEGDYWAILDADVADGETLRLPGRFGAVVEAVVAGGEIWVGLREHGDQIDDAGAGLFTTALALRNWHRRARFCAKCGGETRIAQYGWASRCSSCQREEYPRTDPAVICLVHDDVGVNGEHVLLARGASWPEGARSVLAGFVEAGESLEACVRREIFEEVGVDVDNVRYLGSQPWPFPRSIMLGFAARASRDQPLRPADGEIAEARWYSRAEINAGFARAEQPDDVEPGALRLPGNSSIARMMLLAWAQARP
ncbi:MAG: NAD(+) diphosphatase [Actinophytocola sp.]|nr:NAD(+) diphosphatase [Actinophytocola sp.]